MTNRVCRSAAILLTCLWTVLGAQAAYAQSKYDFDLPAQTLADALLAVGRQTGTNILFEPKALVSVRAPALKGSLSVDDAIARLLANTGLTAQRSSNNTVLVRQSTSGSQPASQMTQPVGVGDVAGAGSITGHAERRRDRRPVAGVRVELRQTGASMITRGDGAFEFVGLAPGSYTLVTRYQGEEAVEQPVVVGAGSRVSVDVLVASELSALEEITVLAQRSTAGLARAAEFEAPNLINLTTADEIERLPDVNAAEALRRVPGVSLESDTGEGRFINIRGLDADLNSTTFGGLRLPPTNNASPFAGGRAVAYDSIPIGFIGAITVTKANLPDQDAEALGGTVEITPKTAPANGKPFANVRVGSGFELLRHTWITDVAATAGTRFGGSGDSQPFSVIVTGAYYEDKRGIDDIEAAFQDAQTATPPVPDKAFNALEQRWYQYDRKRHGYGIDLGYQPDDDNKYYVRYYDAGYTQLANRQRLLLSFGVNYVGGNNVAIDPANSNGFIDNVNFDKTLRDLKEVIDSKVLAAGGSNEIHGMLLDYHVGYTKGTYNKPYDRNPDFQNPAVGVIHYDNTTAPNWPSYTVTGLNPIDPAGYVLHNFTNSSIDSDDHELGIGANLKIPTHFSGATGENLKIGLNARLRRRTNDGQVYSYSSVPALPFAQFASGGNVTFYNGQYQNGPQIDVNGTRALYADGTNPLFVRNAASDAINSALQYQNGKENVYAAYGEYQWGYGQLGLIGGVRIERTDASYASKALVTPVTGAPYIAPVSDSHAYTNYFPSLQARYALAQDLIVRAAVSSTIARPGFNQVNASTSINPAAQLVQTGNPKLNPARATSFDVSITKELPHAGVLSFGVFDKEITDYIVAIQTTQTFPNNGLFAGFVGPAHVFTYGNAPKSRVFGAELNYVQRLRDLVPGPLGGFGVAVNYTWVDSRFEIRPGENSPLPSSSRHTANATLMYETQPLNVSLGAYYVSPNLIGVAGSAATDNWSQERVSVDFGSQYKVTSNLTVHLDVKNLTNTPLLVTEGAGTNRVVQREFYRITALAGFSYEF